MTDTRRFSAFCATLFTISFLCEWYGSDFQREQLWLDLLGAVCSWTVTLFKQESLRRADENPAETCSICLTPLVGNVVAPTCGHPFHWACLTRWMVEKRTCPLCTAAIT